MSVFKLNYTVLVQLLNLKPNNLLNKNTYLFTFSIRKCKHIHTYNLSWKRGSFRKIERMNEMDRSEKLKMIGFFKTNDKKNERIKTNLKKLCFFTELFILKKLSFRTEGTSLLSKILNKKNIIF